MIDIRDHGGIFGGANLSGSQVVRVFTQLTKPSPINVGDVWIETNKTVNEVFFQDYDPAAPSNNDTLIKLGGDAELIVDIEKGMEFIGVTKNQMIVSYPSLNVLNSLSDDMVNIWKNVYMKMYARLGTVKIWNSTESKWVFEIASYWNGTEWVKFSQGDFYSYAVDRGTFVHKIDPAGNIVWSYDYTMGAYITGFNIGGSGDLYMGYYSSMAVIDSNGNYKRDFNVVTTTGTNLGGFTDVHVDKDDFIYLIDTRDNDVLKISKNGGNAIWSAYIGSEGAVDLAIDKDSNVAVLRANGYVKKWDKDGNLIFDKLIRSDNLGSFGHLAIDEEGNMYATIDSFICKINTDGTLAWEYDHDYGLAHDIAIDGKQNVYVGYYNFGELLKINSDGTFGWEKVFGVEDISAVSVDPTFNIYVGTSDNSKYFKSDENGNIVWTIQPANTIGDEITFVEAEPGRVGTFPNKW